MSPGHAPDLPCYTAVQRFAGWKCAGCKAGPGLRLALFRSTPTTPCMLFQTLSLQPQIPMQLKLGAPNFLGIVHSWLRQRAYNLWAVQELGNSPLGVAGWAALNDLQDGKALPNPAAEGSGFTACSLDAPLEFVSGSWRFAVDHGSGGLAFIQRAGVLGPGRHDGAAPGSPGRAVEGGGQGATHARRRGLCGERLAPNGTALGLGKSSRRSHAVLSKIIYSTYSGASAGSACACV